MRHTPRPADATRIRAQQRIMHEFCVERNVLDDDGPASRGDIRAAIQQLDHQERKTLEARLRERMDRLTELMDGTPMSNDEPHVQTDDLVVPLANDTIR